MAYNNKNHLKRVARVLAVYHELKEADIPDTRIVAKKLPEHGINISYRTLMNYKNMKASDFHSAQLSIF